MRLVLEITGVHCLNETSPHDNVWGIGSSICDLRATSRAFWC